LNVSEPTTGQAWVWHAADGYDLRVMHDLIVIRHGAKVRLFECAEHEPPRAVAAALAAAGFAGSMRGSGIELVIEEVEERGLVLMRGFATSVDKLPEIEAGIRDALTGNLGGFVPVLASLAGFHRAAYFAFEHVWASAGMPAVVVRHPGLVGGGGGLASPSNIEQAAWGEARYALACIGSGVEAPSAESRGAS
jgi:hypothetical protein